MSRAAALVGPWGVLLGLALSVGLRAQAVQDRAQDTAADAFWFDRQRVAVAAAAELAGAQDALTVLALRHGGLHKLVWVEYEPDAHRVPPLNPTLLLSVQDNKPFFDFRGKAPDEIPRQALEEEKVQSQAIVQAHETAPELFAQAAREDETRTLTWGHLYRDPGLYRGRVVHMEGRLKRIRREYAPRSARRQGVGHIYEGWVFVTQTAKSNPVCVIFADLPEGLHEAESMDQDVAFDGYFFKRYRYASGEGPRDTLLFVAPTLTVKGPPRTAGGSGGGLPGYVVYAIAGVIAGTAALLVWLSLWFRRGDRQVRRRLAEVQAARALEMFGEPTSRGEDLGGNGSLPAPGDAGPARPNGTAPEGR
jgi:hypothetical protein